MTERAATDIAIGNPYTEADEREFEAMDRACEGLLVELNKACAGRGEENDRPFWVDFDEFDDGYPYSVRVQNTLPDDFGRPRFVSVDVFKGPVYTQKYVIEAAWADDGTPTVVNTCDDTVNPDYNWYSLQEVAEHARIAVLLGNDRIVFPIPKEILAIGH